MIRCVAALILVTFLALAAAAAERPLDPDQAFREAREAAFAGDRARARALLRETLERSPGYHDVKVFLARVHGWDGEHERARELLAEVLAVRPDHVEAHEARIDVALWSHRPEEALAFADAALALDPDRASFKDGRARALAALGRHAADDALPNRIGIDYEYEDFDDLDDPWHELSLDYRRKAAWGSALGRINLARRFGEDGAQFEIDAYPRLGRRNYLYLNVGVSADDLFPDLRYGAELYHNFPRGFEASLGFRRLEFDSSDVTIYTGTLARYRGDWWCSLRSNFVPDRDGDSLSAGLTLRRYFGGRYEYAEVAIGGGIDRGDGLITEREDLLDARARFEIRRRVSSRNILKGLAGWRRQDRSVGEPRDSLFAGIGFEHHF